MLDYMLCRSLQQFLSESVVIVGLALIACGVAVGFLSRRVTRAIRQNNYIDSKDKIFVGLKLTGMLFVVAGFMCIAVDIILYITAK